MDQVANPLLAPAAPSLAREAQGALQLSFEPFLPWALLAALAAALVVLAIYGYARTTRPVPPFRRALLLSLRAAALVLLAGCLTRPVLIQEYRWREKGLCFIALDASASMNLRDAPGNASRWEFAGRLFAQHQSELAALARAYEVRRFFFDAAPRESAHLPGEESAGEKPAGRATDLAAVLERIAAEASGTPCAGALLISDGRHNRPRDPLPAAETLRAAGVPLLAVGVGQEATPAGYREVQLRLLEVPERAFVQGEVQLRLEVESQLPEAARTPLTVTINGAKIREEQLKLPAGRETTQVSITYTPTEVGLHRVVATVKPLPGEANTENNARTAYFRVFQSRLGVWYVEGAIRKEFGALRAALETAPHLTVYALNAFRPAAGAESALLPQTEDAWRGLRLVLLGDLPAKRFARAQLERLARFVEEGGSVLMLGGLNSFGAGDWQDSPLAAVLPVEMSRNDGGADGPLTIVLTREGEGHPAAQLSADPALSRSLWSKLPPLPGVSAVRGVKPAARVLLRAGQRPLLIVQEYGKGRGAAFTGDATWKWVIKSGQSEAHRFFWRNLATWLTRSDYRDASKVVFVEADRLQYLEGDEAALSAQVQVTDATKGRVESAQVTASLEREGGPRKKWELGRGPGEYAARPSLPEAGAYTFRVEVLAADGAVLGRDELGFQVEAVDVEHDNPRANLRLLRVLALRSRGLFYDAEHAGEAFAELLRRPAGFAKTVRESRELWNHWGLFAACVALVTLEWALRKRWGLA